MLAILNDPFESPKGLIQGAKEDLANVEGLIHTYRTDATCVPVVYVDRQTSHKFIKLKVVNPPPPRIRYLVSGILNNLRHSLDQAANAAHIELGGTKRDGYFPFGNDAVGINDVIKRHCKTFAPQLTSYLLTFKPYGGGDDFLYALGKATGPNKHQVTVNIEPELEGFSASDFISQFRGPGELGMLGWDNKKRELTFAHLKSAEAYVATHIDRNTRLPFHIEISGSAAFAGHEATALLNTLISKVEGVLLGIEAETARIMAGRP